MQLLKNFFVGVLAAEDRGKVPQGEKVSEWIGSQNILYLRYDSL